MTTPYVHPQDRPWAPGGPDADLALRRALIIRQKDAIIAELLDAAMAALDIMPADTPETRRLREAVRKAML